MSCTPTKTIKKTIFLTFENIFKKKIVLIVEINWMFILSKWASMNNHTRIMELLVYCVIMLNWIKKTAYKYKKEADLIFCYFKNVSDGKNR